MNNATSSKPAGSPAPGCCSHGGIHGGDAGGRLLHQLPAGHVVHTMMTEHEHILGYLKLLEDADRVIQGWPELRSDESAWQTMRNAIRHLIGAEPHHQREEQVLFPALDERGIMGPPQVMCAEHVELRALKHRVQELCEHPESMDWRALQRELRLAAANLCGLLREHIFKENNVLYPMAMSVITTPAEWDALREACDRIGYCCFSPKR